MFSVWKMFFYNSVIFLLYLFTMKVEEIKVGEKFYYKNDWYKVIKSDETFTYSNKIDNDGYRYLLLNDVEVSMVKDEYFTKNPDHKII